MTNRIHREIIGGHLLVIGGAEDKGSEAERERQNSLDFFKEGILNQILELADKKTRSENWGYNNSIIHSWRGGPDLQKGI